MDVIVDVVLKHLSLSLSLSLRYKMAEEMRFDVMENIQVSSLSIH